jgi:hypothetical protein
MRLSALKKWYSAFARTTPRNAKFFIAFLLLLGGLILYFAASDAYDGYRFNHLPAGEHLRLAQEICHSKQFGAICFAADTSEAVRHLERIASTTPEYGQASELLATIRQQDRRIAERQQKAIAEAQAENTTKQSAAATDISNFTCSRGYPKSCTKEDDGPCALKPIISFDNGSTWRQDDGRCAAREQKKRDEDAEMYSYWPSTIRVDTDMDSFWLPNEERTCQTYSDNKGEVSVVACNASGSHRDHNIPVKFWGGIARNTVSDWKCRREGDQFVCRAID